MAKKTSLARVLVAISSLGVLSGDLLKAPDDTLQALADGGLVDPHPDAVAYAKDSGARVVEVADPTAAAELGAAMVEQPAEPGTEGA